MSIRVGDKVEHIDGDWDKPQVIKEIKIAGITRNKYAIFENDDFYKISNLRKVSTNEPD